jgi:hypothetical protein
MDAAARGPLLRRLTARAGGARMTWLDLAVFSGAVYGAAWVVTRSKLFEPLRGWLDGVPLLGHLVSCIVCTAAWVSLVLGLMLPYVTLVQIRPSAPVDYALLVGWSVAVTWAVGSQLGDAD